MSMNMTVAPTVFRVWQVHACDINCSLHFKIKENRGI